MLLINLVFPGAKHSLLRCLNTFWSMASYHLAATTAAADPLQELFKLDSAIPVPIDKCSVFDHQPASGGVVVSTVGRVDFSSICNCIQQRSWGHIPL